MPDTRLMETGERPPSGAGRSPRVLVLVGVLLMLLGGAAWWFQTTRAEPAETAREPVPTVGAVPGQEVLTSTNLPRELRVRAEPGAPQRLQVPALDLDAPVVPVGAPGGVLTPPADPQTLGWWADGAAPGARLGSALVTGHTVNAGGGAMDDLEVLQDGDRVWMSTEQGRIEYAVRTVVVLGKGELAQRAETIFDQRRAGPTGVDHLRGLERCGVPQQRRGDGDTRGVSNPVGGVSADRCRGSPHDPGS